MTFELPAAQLLEQLRRRCGQGGEMGCKCVRPTLLRWKSVEGAWVLTR